ncbi:hypothetical protein G6011_03859 [Alternaria panax]|uniref:Uncharacterized protein n=1 Tax=Alternaria panax TaxID=48097 RepID=A0AAD4NTN7_9PLEO|nr:hypothetical protein G6011_03859 [Alternaria panax]
MMQTQATPSRIPVRIKVEEGSPLAASLEMPRHRTSHAGPSFQALVRVKVEEVEESAPPLAATPEKPRRYPSFSAFQEKWSQSPLRVPTPLAEEFYRSMIVKRESDEVLGSEDGIPPLCHDCDRSAGLHTKKPSTQAPHDSLSPSPRSVVNIKREAEPSQRVSAIKTEAKSSHRYHVPAGTYKVETKTPSASSKIQHQVPLIKSQSRLYQEARIPDRSTTTPSPAPRPDTELSYLLPITPTPFSTPNAPVNPYNRPAHLHYIPGSLLEGMQRRTKWSARKITDNNNNNDTEKRDRQTKQEKRVQQCKQADRDRQAKQTSRVPVPRSQPLPARLTEYVAESEAGILDGEAGTQTQGATCAWYKIPFCRCCACVVVGGTKLMCNMVVPSLTTVPCSSQTGKKKKWWRTRKCSKRRAVVRSESHAARRSEFHVSEREVVVREV